MEPTSTQTPEPARSTFEAKPMTVAAFAEAAGCSTRHVQRLIERGDLDVRRLGKRIVIPASEVARCLA